MCTFTKDHYHCSFRRMDPIEAHQSIKAGCSWFDVLRGNASSLCKKRNHVCLSAAALVCRVLQAFAGEYALWPKDGNVAVLDSTRVCLCSLPSPPLCSPTTTFPSSIFLCKVVVKFVFFSQGPAAQKFKNNVIPPPVKFHLT